MGAGQIGGFATLLDIDFKNAAGFLGHQVPEDFSYPNFIVYFLSHSMMFCAGTLIEAHVVLVPAICVFGERYQFDVVGGTHKFLEHSGSSRKVRHVATHKYFNSTSCDANNLALLVLESQFKLHEPENGTRAEFIVGRLRYGYASEAVSRPPEQGVPCTYFGWGSRRNGFLVPLLIYLRKLDTLIMPQRFCDKMWNCNKKFLCLKQRGCRSPRYGALCPDDLGTVLVCKGVATGMMVSRLVDRPCGVGFLDLLKYTKFLTCGVDESKEIVLDADDEAGGFNNLELSGITVNAVSMSSEDAETTTSQSLVEPYKIG